MDTWLPFGRMPSFGNHLAGPGRLAGRQSSLHGGLSIEQAHQKSKDLVWIVILNYLIKNISYGAANQ